MTVEDIASQLQLAVSEYDDVEARPDEFIDVISAAEAKALCAALGLSLAGILALEPLDVDASAVLPSEHSVERAVLLRRRRECLGVSAEELAFAIGFEVGAIEQLEHDDRYIESLPISVIAEVALKLQLPLMALIECLSQGQDMTR